MTDLSIEKRAADPGEHAALEADRIEDETFRLELAKHLIRRPTAWAWGLAAGAGIGAVALHWTPAAAVTLAIVGFGLGVLGYIDSRTKLILNRHTGLFAAMLFGVLLGVQLQAPGEPVLLTAIGTALGAFVIMLILWWVIGFASGGDIKLAPVAAAGLSLVSPLLAVLWLMLAFMLCMGVTIYRAATANGAPRQSVPMAPLMAIAVPFAIVLTVWLYAAMSVAIPNL
jgi:hypothetical protein